MNRKVVIAATVVILAVWLGIAASAGLWLILAFLITPVAVLMTISAWKNQTDKTKEAIWEWVKTHQTWLRAESENIWNWKWVKTHQTWIINIWEWVKTHRIWIIIIGVVALVLTLLTGFWYGLWYRHLPWACWFSLYFQLGLLVTLASLYWRYPKEVGNKVAYAAGRWVRRGGFWLFWKEDNLPANSLMLISVWWLVMAGLYGLPTPAVDPLMETWKAQEQIESAVNAPAALAAKETGSFIAQAFLGKKADIQEKTENKPKALYPKGWFWAKGAFLFFLPGIFGLMFSRRDEAAYLIGRMLETIKGKAKSAVDAGGAAASAALAKTGSGPESELATHISANFLTEGVIAVLSGLHKTLARKGAL